MYAAVIDDVHLIHFRARFFQNAAHAFTERVVSHVTEMKRFIRIRTRIFDHNSFSVEGLHTLCVFRTVLASLTGNARKDRKRSGRFVELHVHVRTCCKEFADGRYENSFERRLGIDNMHDALGNRRRCEAEKFCIGEHRNADIAHSGIGRSLQRQSIGSDS